MFGYTIANAMSEQLFHDAADFIRGRLCFDADGEVLEDIDGSLVQHFRNGTDMLELHCDAQTDCVYIKASQELPIACLYKWKTA